MAPDRYRLIRFAREHENADIHRLLLGTPPEGVDARRAAEQIQARRKARDKLPGWYAAPDVLFPPPLSVEQASSERTAQYKATLLSGHHLVDLTGGMGVDTLALAERFDKATYVEQDPELCERFAHNAELLSDRPVEVVCRSAGDFLAGFHGTATFFVDPARRDDGGRRVSGFEASSPDVVSLLPRLRQTADRALIKASPMIDVTEAARQLQAVAAVHVVSVANECREVLFLLDFAQSDSTGPESGGRFPVCCVDLKTDGTAAAFQFLPAEERTTPVTWGEPGRFLYDLNAAIRKAGAFRTVAARFALVKLAPNTHLYTSDELVNDFPGRVLEVTGYPVTKPARQLPDRRANVMSRNHPLSADQLRQRFKLRDGGDHWLVGFRDQGGRARLLTARAVD